MSTDSTERLPWLKAYDIRGRVGTDLRIGEAYEIGLAYAAVIAPTGPVAVGYDARLESPLLAEAVASGLLDGGADVTPLGLCGTELVYFAGSLEGMGGGIMITASHNPKGDNGMKLVYRDLRRGVLTPVTRENGLLEMEERVRTGRLERGRTLGSLAPDSGIVYQYVERVLSFVGGVELKPLKIVCNSGNGAAGPTLDRLAPHLPFEIIRVQHHPDGNFPHGVPNPILPETRGATIEAVQAHGADLGVAWDGDFDRCFLFDETGGFIEGYYIVGLLADMLLRVEPGGGIIHDPRLYWNTEDIVQSAGGQLIRSRTGHARIKQCMVDTGAVYGGEMSAHHYFRDFAHADAGMIPWLVVAALMSETGAKLSDIIEERMAKFPCSGEINREVADPRRTFDTVQQHYEADAVDFDHFDGLSMAFADWRFNLRQSDTQPEKIRLNVESRGDRALMEAKTQEVLDLIGG